MIQEIQGFKTPVGLTVLPNGLTLIVAENNSQIATAQFTIRVGSNHEKIGQEGIAHYLEHVLCEGPARNGVHPMFNDLAKKAVLVNAATSFFDTRYFATGLSIDIFEIIAALYLMTFKAIFSKKTVDGERGPIVQELEETERNYEFSFFENSVLFPNYSYVSYPTAGILESVEQITFQDLLQFHRDYYCLKNAVLIVAGNISMFALVEQASEFPQSSGNDLPFQEDLQLTHKRDCIYTSPNGDSVLHLYFPAPDSLQAHIYFDTVLRMLCDPPFGLVFRKLRLERQLMYGINYQISKSPIPYADIEIPCQQDYFEEVIESICELIQLIMDDLYSDELFAYISAYRNMQFIQKDENIPHSSSYVSELSSAWRTQSFDFNEEEYCRNATRDDLARVTREYLDPAKMSIIRVIPSSK